MMMLGFPGGYSGGWVLNDLQMLNLVSLKVEEKRTAVFKLGVNNASSDSGSTDRVRRRLR